MLEKVQGILALDNNGYSKENVSIFGIVVSWKGVREMQFNNPVS